jgi:hypothetical protein
MKKLLVILTILVMSVLLLASCDLGGKPDNGGNDNANVNVCPHNNLVEHPETNSTCAKHGKTSGIQCMDCGEFTVAQAEKPLLAHRLQTIPAREATCNTNGATEAKRCVMCLQFIEPAVTIPKFDHVINGESKVVDSDDVEATCTEAGSTGGKHCSVCYATVEEATVTDAPTGHDYDWVVSEEAATVEIGTCKHAGCGHTVTRTLASDPDVEEGGSED